MLKLLKNIKYIIYFNNNIYPYSLFKRSLVEFRIFIPFSSVIKSTNIYKYIKLFLIYIESKYSLMMVILCVDPYEVKNRDKFRNYLIEYINSNSVEIGLFDSINGVLGNYIIKLLTDIINYNDVTNTPLSFIKSINETKIHSKLFYHYDDNEFLFLSSRLRLQAENLFNNKYDETITYDDITIDKFIVMMYYLKNTEDVNIISEINPGVFKNTISSYYFKLKFT